MFADPLAANQHLWYRRYLLAVVAAIVVAAFLLLPWPFESKARAALHGLCAQRPSHSFAFGDRTLPFDARMTGIYGGFAVTAAYLTARGRLRATLPPPPAVLAALGLGVAALAADGANSFLVDVGLWHPYAPDNRLRLVTGLATGTALAVLIAYLLASTLWPPRPGTPILRGVGDLAPLPVLHLPLALVVLAAPPALYVPVSLLLLLAAVTVVGSLCLVVLVLARRQDGLFHRPSQLQAPAATALLLALVVMAAIGGARFLLEHLTGTPPLT